MKIDEQSALDDIPIGDPRKVGVAAVDMQYRGSAESIGLAWQAGNNDLAGTGLAAILLFEPSARRRYSEMGSALHVSPLTVLYKRISRSQFFRAYTKEPSDVGK